MRTLELLIVAGALLSGCAFDNAWILPRGASPKDDGRVTLPASAVTVRWVTCQAPFTRFMLQTRPVA